MAVESLRDLVLRRAREIGGTNGELTNREIARRSQGAVSYTLVGQIVNGEYSNKVPGVKVLEGLARALDVRLPEVEAAAGAPPSFGPFQLSEEAHRLTPSQRKAVKHVVEVFLEGNEPAAAPRPLKAVARRGNPEGAR